MYRTLDDAVKQIAHNNPRKREAVAQYLGQIDDPRRVEYLIRMLEDADERVREQAAAALAKTQDERAIDPLIACFVDPQRKALPNIDGEVSVLIPEAIKKFGSTAAAHIIPALSNPIEAWQKNLIWLLGEIGDPSSVQPLIDAHNSTEEGAVRYSIKEALKVIGTREANMFLGSLKKHW